MNKTILIGRMTRDVDLRYSQNAEGQTAIGRFSVAVDRRTTGADGRREADFISCVAFGKTAENIAKFFPKGRKIALTGRIQTGSYQKQDGTKVYTTDVVAEEFDFCESPAQEQAQNAAQNTAAYYAQQPQQGAYQPQANNYSPQYHNVPQYMPQQNAATPPGVMNQGFMAIPDDVDAPGLPFN